MHLYSEHKLFNLLTQSRSRNEAHNITGMLLYVDGNFVQVLEGNQFDVKLIFRSIELDNRHRGIIVLDEGKISERCFPQWSMGFRSASLASIRGIPGFDNMLTTDIITKLHEYQAKELLNWYKNISGVANL